MALVLAEKETQFQNQVHNFYFYIFYTVERKKKKKPVKNEDSLCLAQSGFKMQKGMDWKWGSSLSVVVALR